MTDDDPRTEPLREWNRLARENTENAIVSSMFEAASKASEPIETFATWLLVGTAAVASFFITNAEKLLPLVNRGGFVVCGAFLCLSCVFGLLSKVYALRCKIGIDMGSAVRKTFAEHLASYEIEEKKIEEGAQFWGITLQTGIRIDRVLAEFLSPQPKWIAWLALRQLRKNAANPQIGYLSLIRSLNAQGMWASLQVLAFLGFMVSGFVYAASSKPVERTSASLTRNASQADVPHQRAKRAWPADVKRYETLIASVLHKYVTGRLAEPLSPDAKGAPTRAVKGRPTHAN